MYESNVTRRELAATRPVGTIARVTTLPGVLQGRSKLFWAGLIVVAVSLAPLLLYIAFGPADGNPIGLGLLMFFGVPAGAILAFIGFALGRRT